MTRKRAALTTVIERIEVRVDRIDIGLRPPGLAALLDGPDTSPQGANDEETELVLTDLDIRQPWRPPLRGRWFADLYGGFSVKWFFGLLPVPCLEVCPGKAGMFSRRQSWRGRSQSPVVRVAEEMETEPSKPIDKISRGEITSHRAVSKENALWPRKK